MHETFYYLQPNIFIEKLRCEATFHGKWNGPKIVHVLQAAFSVRMFLFQWRYVANIAIDAVPLSKIQAHVKLMNGMIWIYWTAMTTSFCAVMFLYHETCTASVITYDSHDHIYIPLALCIFHSQNDNNNNNKIRKIWRLRSLFWMGVSV